MKTAEDLIEAIARLVSSYEVETGRRAGCVLMLGAGRPALYFNGEQFDVFARLRSVR